MPWGLDVTAICHDTAHLLRRRVREALYMGAPPDAVADMVRANLNEAMNRILDLTCPCGQFYADDPAGAVKRMCERERGHDGEHRGNL